MTSFRANKYKQHDYTKKVDSFVVIWDLETSNLSPRFGFMLTAGWKAWRGGKPCPCHGDYRVHMPSIRDIWQYHNCAERTCRAGRHRVGEITDDRYVTDAISKVLKQADVHVTYNGKRYDWRWVQTRSWGYGWDILPAGIPHVDLLYTARSQLAGGASLKAISSNDPTLEGLAKSPVSGPEWVAAVSGNPSALAYVEKHCKADVLVLEHEYERLQGHVWQHPRLQSDPLFCKFDGGVLVKHKTRRTALANPTIQYQCKACGRYQSLVAKKGRAA